MPNEKYAALVEAVGYVPVALSAEDYIELLPATWRAVNAYGIKISHRVYDSAAVVTTQEQARAFVNVGSGPGGNTIVYLVTMKGHFTWPRAGPVPLSGQRAPAPTGHYLYVMVSAETWRWRRTFDEIARGLRPSPPPVAQSSLGPVTWLKR